MRQAPRHHHRRRPLVAAQRLLLLRLAEPLRRLEGLAAPQRPHRDRRLPPEQRVNFNGINSSQTLPHYRWHLCQKYHRPHLPRPI